MTANSESWRAPARTGLAGRTLAPIRMAWLAAIAAFASGLLNILCVFDKGHSALWLWLSSLAPFEMPLPAVPVLLVSGTAMIAIGFELARSKRRALFAAAVIGAVSGVSHLEHDHGAAGSISWALLTAVLWVGRSEFDVRSAPLLRIRPLAAFTLASATAWLAYTRDGVAANALGVVSIAAMLYSFRRWFDPVLYSCDADAEAASRAERINADFGLSGQDFFKSWPDKSQFFSSVGRTYIAYRVAHGCAIVLGDPVGPSIECESTLREFIEFCRVRDWTLAFHQVRPDKLHVYERLGFRHLLVGEDAYVELADFGLQGKGMKEFRNTVTRLQRAGVRLEDLERPIPDAVLRELHEVSDEWLSLPGRRERRFTLGAFDPEYISGSRVFLVRDAQGKVLAFLNLTPAYSKEEASVDLMRRRAHAPNGVIDFLFTTTFLRLKEEGFARVNIGMCPLSGEEPELATDALARVLSRVLGRFESLFSFRGLRSFKSKYSNCWEPRYALFRRPWDLPRYGLALRSVTEGDD